MRGQTVRMFDVLPGWLWAFLCAGAISSAAVSSYRLKSAQAIHAEYVAGAEKAARQMSEQYRAKELEIARAQEVNAAETKALHLDLGRARNRAAVQSARMRDAINAAAQRAREGCAVATTTDLRPPTDDPIGVLADVLGRADERAGVLADLADRRGIAGRACERAYDDARKVMADQLLPLE